RDQTNQIYINSVGVISYSSFGLLGGIVGYNLAFVVGRRRLDEASITVYHEDSWNMTTSGL
ncbi:hypothetical protein K435DRAFT_785068, partial [Dendrothele bispora CBS 962.96]